MFIYVGNRGTLNRCDTQSWREYWYSEGGNCTIKHANLQLWDLVEDFIGATRTIINGFGLTINTTWPRRTSKNYSTIYIGLLFVGSIWKQSARARSTYKESRQDDLEQRETYQYTLV